MTKLCTIESIKKIYSIVFNPFFISILLWALFTPFSEWLDLKASRFFYHKDSFLSHPIWDWLYIYGIWPAWMIQVFACIGLICSLFQSFRNWRRPCLFLMLTFAIGSGLIIHVCLKDHWGRPRPKQVYEFGGKQFFRPYYQPNLSQKIEPSKSFACGHASMGFYFFAFVILGLNYKSRSLSWFGWLSALVLGGLLSLARIAQGGHFLSDTLASALVMWLTSWTLANFLLIKDKKNERINTDTT